jgi:hypothetical protein
MNMVNYRLLINSQVVLILVMTFWNTLNGENN